MKWGTWTSSPLQSPGAASRATARVLFPNPKDSTCLQDWSPLGLAR